jgi:methionyl-tRNA synthetase
VFYLTGTDEHGQKVLEKAVQRHGDPEAHVSALQVELLRSLYMDTKTLARDPDRFAHAKHFCCELVRKLLETARS